MAPNDTLKISPGWAAIWVAVVVPLMAALLSLAGDMASAKTTQATMEKRIERVEAKIDSIAERVGARMPHTASAAPRSTIEAGGPCRELDQPVRFVAANPLP